MFSLILLVKPTVANIIAGKFIIGPIDITAFILLGLSVFLIVEGTVVSMKRDE